MHKRKEERRKKKEKKEENKQINLYAYKNPLFIV
jgi:hypothetical protein